VHVLNVQGVNTDAYYQASLCKALLRCLDVADAVQRWLSLMRESKALLNDHIAIALLTAVAAHTYTPRHSRDAWRSAQALAVQILDCMIIHDVSYPCILLFVSRL
jgi:O-glycosyl hydrolase